MNQIDDIAVIIPAAGVSSRFGGSMPKQFYKLGDETVVEQSVNLFLGISGIKLVVIAVNQNNNLIKSQSFYHDPRIKIVEGGSTRSESVFNAMAKVDQDTEIVVIHDAARPWLKKTHFEQSHPHKCQNPTIYLLGIVLTTHLLIHDYADKWAYL